MTQAVATIGMSEVKANFSKVANRCHDTNTPITVFKRNKPWVNITPVNYEQQEEFLSYDCLNEETKEAILELEKAIEDGSINQWKTYSSASEMFKDLGI